MPLIAATWSLQSTASNAAEFSFGLQQEGGESVFEDERPLVAPMHFARGGKYRCEQPDDSRHAMGTGWLIRDDLLVTAGHCAYDWKDSFGRASEFRHGVRIVTAEGWLQSSANRHNDVACIQLNAPFTGVVPFQFADTPLAGSDSIGVVGNPGDMRFKGEPGAQMYEEFKAVQLIPTRKLMRSGQSGSPVLLEHQPHISIGAHVYGDVGNNSASPIDSDSGLLLGNPYADYISVFDPQTQYAVQKSGPSTGIQYLVLDRLGHRQTRSSEENFWDNLKDVLHVGAPIVPGGIEDLSAAASSPGSAQESILAEAAPQAFLEADAEKIKEMGISTKIMVEYQKAAADAEAVAAKVLPTVVMPAALHVTQDALAGTSTESSMVTFGTASAARVSALSNGFSSPSFAAYSTTIASSGDAGSADAFTMHLVRSAQRRQVMRASGFIPKAKTESAFDIEEAPMDQHMKILGRRALLAGATLRVLRDLPSNQLNQLEQLPCPAPTVHHGLGEHEGGDSKSFFTAIQSAAQKIAPAVIKYAPVVVWLCARLLRRWRPRSSNSSSRRRAW
ncbi:trypsin-like serine peptidase [Aspergillus homomorphus CBS 101889]|uniref:Serine protease n=1 Tax=Aspergillus homomorphus (strain CBS 101889) TaxID=1450537 RepID=A0A395I4P1_ASPHC|nr:hypothetical protein BO97DRAFT_413348 [Aspergillus homomorphus CBS 101889]RAL13344.1 hypothetical protein BO97DRAFT_413348 [Aspergillus homomorphus CBS 101889]